MPAGTTVTTRIFMQPTEDNQDQPLSDYVFFLAANSSNPEKSGEAQVMNVIEKVLLRGVILIFL